MAQRPGVKSVMVEFNRFGEEGDILQKGTSYIRTTGDDKPACEIKVGLGYREFVRHFYALRYPKGVKAEDVDAALKTLEIEAGNMLGELPVDAEETVQIDLVASAAELWAFPFEAYSRTKRGVVLTRRIRGNFGEHATWPPVPKILFVHAAVGADLKRELVDEHVAALKQALHPWTGGADPTNKVLFVRELYSLPNLEKARSEATFTHIHLLAHGIPVDALDGPPLKDWGLRLGPPGTKGTHPKMIADALARRDGVPLPVAVTVASCDSANQSDSAAASWSLAQELHRLGIPVVVASQLPLTTHGSVLLTKHFYEPLLRGEDVRNALDDVRSALHDDKDAAHDWLSVVAYVRLPETYDDHLDKVALKMELAMLRAAQRRADEVIKQNNLAALKDVEQRVRDRIASLEIRLRDLQDEKDRLECQGLLASAHKRLAELLFLAGRDPAEQRQALETSLKHYSDAFQSNLNMHWQGVQKLSLQAVLHGAFDDPLDYAIVMRGARASLKNDEKDYWPLGTIAELHLLAAFAGQPVDLDQARAAIERFKELADGKDDDIDSTRRQIVRYVGWWTPRNGFKTDLAEHASALAALLPKKEPV